MCTQHRVHSTLQLCAFKASIWFKRDWGHFCCVVEMSRTDYKCLFSKLPRAKILARSLPASIARGQTKNKLVAVHGSRFYETRFAQFNFSIISHIIAIWLLLILKCGLRIGVNSKEIRAPKHRNRWPYLRRLFDMPRRMTSCYTLPLFLEL